MILTYDIKISYIKKWFLLSDAVCNTTSQTYYYYDFTFLDRLTLSEQLMLSEQLLGTDSEDIMLDTENLMVTSKFILICGYVILV